MSNSIERYVIKYISGSKMNQEEMLDFNKAELSIGRVPGCDIQFDAVQDLIVSREHGKIVREGTDPPSFTIVDNHSRNGIFVNKSRVKGSAKLNPGDVVQLGDNGPAFVFDIYPRPHDMMAATQTIEIPTSIRPTTVSATEQQVPPVAEPIKTGLGKQTVERMLVAERKKSYKTLTLLLVGLVLLLGVLGYIFKDQLFKKVPEKELTLKKTPEQIARENADRVVQIEFGWKIFDIETNEELWHASKKVIYNGVTSYVPMYIKNNEGKIEPYLVLKKYAHSSWNDRPIGMAQASGSGFVISPDGFILTNRHIGTGWNSMYTYHLAFPGVLVDYNQNPIRFNIMPQDVGIWVPAKARMISGKDVGNGNIRGENTFMNVVFAGTSLRRPVNSRSVTPSDNHDVALIKIEIPESLSEVTINDNYDEVSPGQSVTVMGYPGIAPQPFVLQQSNDVFNPVSEFTSKPTPTVTPGSIGRKIPASSQNDNTYSWIGDLYQLTINATGSGNSGGPLFDDEGKVIGIFSAGMLGLDGTKITFAVPIKYGLELMGPKKKTGS